MLLLYFRFHWITAICFPKYILKGNRDYLERILKTRKCIIYIQAKSNKKKVYPEAQFSTCCSKCDLLSNELIWKTES